MDLTNVSTIKNLLFSNNTQAKKSFGQNFLISKKIIDKAIKKANVSKEDNIVEVGPGIGVLTVELCKNAKSVKSVELDRDAITILKKTTVEYDNLEIVEMNALKYEPEKNHITIRLRVDGQLVNIGNIDKPFMKFLVSRIKVMAKMDISENRIPQDGRMNMDLNGSAYAFRVATLPSMHGENIVIRILNQGSISKRIGQLGFPEDILSDFQKAYNVSNGIVLITGPTGSGKTTTLYAILNELNNGEKNIISIENPIEYELPGITQSQVNAQAGMTFDAGLRAMMRLDPDVLMVGEIRDAETAKVATESAMTGHLVLSTTHTNDSTSAPSRMIEMGTEPFLIASTMRAILAQRLVRKLCDECKYAYTPEVEILERILSYRPESLSVSNVDSINQLWSSIQNADVQFYKSSGCEHCKNLGYAGRVPVYELFLPNEETSQLIVQKKNATEVRKASYKHGMRTLLEDALELTIQGYTSIEEVFRVVV